jgi:hypothetical protein
MSESDSTNTVVAGQEVQRVTQIAIREAIFILTENKDNIFDEWYRITPTHDMNIWVDDGMTGISVYPGGINKDGYWETDTSRPITILPLDHYSDVIKTLINLQA